MSRVQVLAAVFLSKPLVPARASIALISSAPVTLERATSFAEAAVVALDAFATTTVVEEPVKSALV